MANKKQLKGLDLENMKEEMMRRSIAEVVSHRLVKSKAEARRLFEREWPIMKKYVISLSKFYSKMPTFIQIKRRVLRDLKAQLKLGQVDGVLPRLINKINNNPDLVTTYSCSGAPDPKIKPFHRGEGRPVIGIRFNGVSTMKLYSKELRCLGYEIIEEQSELKVQSDKFLYGLTKTMGFLLESEKRYPRVVIQIAHTNTKENFMYGKAGKSDRMATPTEARKFWNDVTLALSNHSHKF
jgi:hypothetical protein